MANGGAGGDMANGAGDDMTTGGAGGGGGSPGGKGGCSCDVGHDGRSPSAPAPSPLLLGFVALLLFRLRRRGRAPF